ncbi:hypothetical protein ACA910_005955 [Epithemia clementina (nom. ined.)]
MLCVNDIVPRYKAKAIQKLDDNVFLVVATLKSGKMPKSNKNMVVIRHNKRELTLVNPVHLDEEGESLLLKLGTFQRIIRLAPRQGIEHDKHYLQKYPSVRRWAPKGDSQYSDELPVHRLLTADDDAILPGCHVFSFQATAHPECALIILQDYVGNLLVTAEALQAHRDNPYINIPTRTQLAARGLMAKDVVIPSFWIRHMHTSKKGDKTGLRNDMEALLRLDFERLVSYTGVMIHQRAKENVVVAVEQSLPLW